MREYLDGIIKSVSDVTKLTAVKTIEDIWGLEGFLELPEETQRELILRSGMSKADRLSSANDIVRREAQLREKRSNLLRELCEARGWDPTLLTIEQLRTIYDSSEWLALESETDY